MYTHYSLFGEPWWLDAACGKSTWHEVNVVVDGQTEARWPYVYKKRYGLRIITQPPFTQILGPWFSEFDGKTSSRLAREKDLYQKLLAQFPDYSIFRQSFHWSHQNGLPMHWAGFSETAKYTYVIDDLRDESRIWNGLQSNIRREIRKAEKRYGLFIEQDDSESALLVVIRKTYRRQGLSAKHLDVLARLVKASASREQGEVLTARDKDGAVHASIFIAWDDRCAYYIAGGGDPDFRNSGAHSLLMWEAIKRSAGRAAAFDFEGSVREPIERFFRAFGAEQRKYSFYEAVPNPLLRGILALKGSR